MTVSEISAAFWPARLVNFHPTSATLLLRPEAEDRLKLERLWVRPPRLPPKSCVEKDLEGAARDLEVRGGLEDARQGASLPHPPFPRFFAYPHPPPTFVNM